VPARHGSRDPEEFRRTEYSPERQAVYSAARYQIDSSLPIEDSLRKFRVALYDMLSGRAHLSGTADTISR
jgi:hypothetical protein